MENVFHHDTIPEDISHCNLPKTILENTLPVLKRLKVLKNIGKRQQQKLKAYLIFHIAAFLDEASIVLNFIYD